MYNSDLLRDRARFNKDSCDKLTDALLSDEIFIISIVISITSL